MASLFKKLKKTLSKVEKRLPAPLERAANTMVNPARSYATFLSDQSNCSDWACRRAALRRHHERETTPWSSTAKKSRTADELLASGDPAQVAQGQLLRAEVDEATLKRGVIGMMIGGAVVGGAAGSALAGGSEQAGATGGKGILRQYESLMPDGTVGYFPEPVMAGERAPITGMLDPAEPKAVGEQKQGSDLGGVLLVGGLLLAKLLVA